MKRNRALLAFAGALLLLLGVAVLTAALTPETIRYAPGSPNDFFYTPRFLHDLLPADAKEVELLHSFGEVGAPDLDAATFVAYQSEDRVRDRIHKILVARGFESYGTVEYEKNRDTPGWKIVTVRTEELTDNRTSVDLTISHMDSILDSVM